MAEERKKVSPEQLSILIEELENDPSLQTGKGSARNTKILYVEKWEALARKLNSVESGALKNVTKWQQMAKTNAERVREYRERLKLDPDKYEEKKKKHREYMRSIRRPVKELPVHEQKKLRRQWKKARDRKREKFFCGRQKCVDSRVNDRDLDAWRDWKSNTRKKAVKTALDGSSELTSLELRVLNMCEGDQADVKPGGIDISNIAEMDPLSSEENSCDGQDNCTSPELLTVYSNDIKVEDEDENGKRSCSEDEAVNITRKRIKMFPEDKNNEKLTDIVSRLITIEASRIESENQRTKLLQDIATSMGRQVAAAERQADALTRIVELLERDRDG